MLCNKCGTENNESSKFCISCGNPLQQVSQPTMTYSNDNLQNNISVGMDNPMNQQPVVNNEINSVNPMNQQPIVNNEINSVNPMNQPVVNNKEKKVKKGMNKKLLLIIGIVVIVAAIVAGVLIFMSGGKLGATKDLTSLIDIEQPIPVKKDYKYMYIDTNGKIIKDIKYNEISDFVGGYATVELEDGTAAIIDKNQNVLVTATSFYGMEYIDDFDLWLIDGVLYNSKFKAITDKTLMLSYEEEGYFTYNNLDYSEYGIMNKDGKKIYSSSCEISLDVNSYSINDEYYGILEVNCYNNDQIEEKEFIIELQNGKIVYENKYLDQNPNSYYYYHLQNDRDNMFYIIDSNYDKLAYIYLKDNQVVYETNEKIEDLSLYGLDYIEVDYGYYYEENGKQQRYYYYDIKNKKMLEEEPEIEDIDESKDIDITKRQVVSCSYGEGLITNKKVIVPCMYDDISELPSIVHEYLLVKESKDLVYIEDNDSEYLYNASNGKKYLEFEEAKSYKIYDYATSLLIKQEISVDYTKTKTIVYNLLTGQSIQFDAKSDITIKTNYFIEEKAGNRIYYNMSFEKIYTES